MCTHARVLLIGHIRVDVSACTHTLYCVAKIVAPASVSLLWASVFLLQTDLSSTSC